MTSLSLLLSSVPSPGEIWEWVLRLVEWLKLGGVALAMLGCAIFLGTWVLSHLRPTQSGSSSTLSAKLALGLSYVPVGLTIFAAVASFVPTLAPWVLKTFALAVVAAGLSWSVSVVLLVRGGTGRDLSRLRRAILLAGTPWYCLALWLSNKLAGL